MTTIEIDFPQPIEIKSGYEGFFEGLKQMVKENALDEPLGEGLRKYVADFLTTCDFNDFQTFSDTLYERIYLGKDFETGWEALMMCWKKDNQTAIHGHPQFAAYNFASGKFLVEVFKETANGEAKLVDSIETEEGQGFFAIGNAETFDNHIHRITCLSDIGFSLHIYSDDARKGKKYEIAK